MKALLPVLISIVAAGCATQVAESNSERVIVVLGASSGFGKGTALKLADQGAHLVLAARRTDELKALVQEVERRGAKAIAVTTDASREDEVQRLGDSARDKFGHIDVWINMAGVGAIGRFDEIPLEDHHRVVDVNLKGVMNGSHYALRHFKERGMGTLVNISSVTGRISVPYQSSYAATKHGVSALGVALNQELRLNRDADIHVSTILPYAADTPFWDHAANYSGHQPRIAQMDDPEKVVDAIVQATLEPRPEISVGYRAKAALASHRLSRRLTERTSANKAHESLMEDSPSVPNTQGALYEPMEGTSSVGGRMEERGLD
jgi:short-subunit dehydrogenase